MPDVEGLEAEIKMLISRSPSDTDPIHSVSTRKWVLCLKSDADLALQIAALAHDIDRGVDPKYRLTAVENHIDYNDHKRIHAQNGAKIIAELLYKHGFDDAFVEKVFLLVSHHEVGGDVESDILMNADSISFFEGNLARYFEKHGEDGTRKKMRFMFMRMSEPAKRFLHDFKYDDPVLQRIFAEETSYC